MTHCCLASRYCTRSQWRLAWFVDGWELPLVSSCSSLRLAALKKHRQFVLLLTAEKNFDQSINDQGRKRIITQTTWYFSWTADEEAWVLKAKKFFKLHETSVQILMRAFPLKVTHYFLKLLKSIFKPNPETCLYRELPFANKKSLFF